MFRLGSRRLSLDANRVAEVVRATRITRVPHGPDSLLGIANIRGEPVPIVALGRLLGDGQGGRAADGCIIVYERGQRIGLMVDAVLQIVADDSVKISDLDARLAAEIRPASSGRRNAVVGQRSDDVDTSGRYAKPVDAGRAFLSVRIAGQSFAVALKDVHEVVALGAELATTNRPDDVILGMTEYRGTVLPVAAAKNLLGLRSHGERLAARIVIVEFQGTRIGLAVDSVQTIVRLASSQIDTVPAVLKSGQGPAELEAIGRPGDGQSLIAILSTEKLFGNQAVHQVARPAGEEQMTGKTKTEKGEQFLIFALGSEEYGLPIRCVEEIVRVPETVTRVPKAPSFVAGVINLRGKAVPLIDQRMRFEVTDANPLVRPRAVVVTIGETHVGFVVDRVSETVEIAAEDLLETPDISEHTSVFDRVARLRADGRMILLVDPKELLTHAEQDVVAAVARTGSKETIS